jgi:transposase
MQSPLLLGVDVAKAEVVIADSQNTFALRTLPNEPGTLRAFLLSLPPRCHLAMESTGPYHQRLAELAVALGHSAYVLNPKDIYHYAKALGARAKTDRADAQLIARYLAHEHQHLHPYVPPTTEQKHIDQLVRRRAKVASLRLALQRTCQELPNVQRAVHASVQALTALIRDIDAQIATLNRTIAGRRQQLQHLQSVIGIGPVTGTWLANLLDRVTFHHSDALVAFVGLDPRPCDSGQHRGRRRLSKRGPAEGRRLLFNAAMAAVKSPVWQPLYQHHRQHGWSSTAALIIIARKLLRVAFALYKTQTTFNPNLITLKT